MSFVLILSGALVVVAAITLLRSTRRRTIAASALAFSQTVALPLTPEVSETVERRVTTRMRASGIGLLAGAVAGLGVAALVDGLDEGLTTFTFAGTALSVLATAWTIGVLRREPADGDSVRIARSEAVRLDDYVPPVELVTVRIAGTLALVGPILVSVAWMRGADVPTSAPWILGAATLSLVVWVLVEVLARRIVARGPRVGSPIAMAWDDALRAETLRRLIALPLVFMIQATLPSAVEGARLLFGEDGFWGTAGLIIAMTPAIGLLLLLVIVASATPERHYLRRLWPAQAALLAAQSAPSDDDERAALAEGRS